MYECTYSYVYTYVNVCTIPKYAVLPYCMKIKQYTYMYIHVLYVFTHQEWNLDSPALCPDLIVQGQE